MSCQNSFHVEYKLLNIQEIYGKHVSLNYRPNIPPQYFVDADIDFYFDGNKFFSQKSFSIFKFASDARSWFNKFFPETEFVWNEDGFDGWDGKIIIAPRYRQVLFKVIFEDETDLRREIDVYIPADDFSTGFAEFLAGFKQRAESFWRISFDLVWT